MNTGILTLIVFAAILVQMAVLMWVGIARRRGEVRRQEADRNVPDA